MYRRWGERADFILQPALPRRAPKPALGQVLTGWKAIRRDESRLEVRSQLVCASFFDGHVTNRKKRKKDDFLPSFFGKHFRCTNRQSALHRWSAVSASPRCLGSEADTQGYSVEKVTGYGLTGERKKCTVNTHAHSEVLPLSDKEVQRIECHLLSELLSPEVT